MDLDTLQDAVNEAAARARPLALCGRGSRLPPPPQAQRLDLADLAGVEDHDPRELVVTVRPGTPVAALQAQLAEAGQTLACDPPRPRPESTLGGALASGAAGPDRPWQGDLRSALLGLDLINGRGERLAFGGRVLKNVAGYDLSRLQVGAWGLLGIVTRLHLRTCPLPEQTLTQVVVCDQATALAHMRRWQRQPWPLAGLAWHDGHLWYRLAGLEAGVRSARHRLGGDPVDAPSAAAFWSGLRDGSHPFLRDAPLWRLSLPPAAPPLPLEGAWLLDWGGALRWYRGPEPAARIQACAREHGGWAMPWPEPRPLRALPAPQRRLLERLKEAFDPYHLFNPHLLDA